MDINITGRHITIPEKLKGRIIAKLEKLVKYDSTLEEAKVVLKIQKDQNIIEVSLKGKNVKLVAKETTKKMIDSLNAVASKLERSLKKEKEKLKNKKNVSSVKQVSNLNSSNKKTISVKKEIVIFENKFNEMLSVENAIEIMENNSYQFYVFTDEETKLINVVYKINDKKYGLIIS